VINPSQRPLPDNTRHSQQINIHVPGGIRRHNLSRRAAEDLRLRPRGHWYRLNFIFTLHYFLIQVDHIEMYWYPTDFPQSSVGRAFLSPADTTLCLVSQAIVSRLLPLRDVFKFATAIILLHPWTTDDNSSAPDQCCMRDVPRFFMHENTPRKLIFVTTVVLLRPSSTTLGKLVV
jgi:hypothetical protein